MESIKKQSLPSNPTAIPAPTWRFPSISAPGRHLCGAVSHVETLQAIRRVTTATAASRSQLPAPSSLLPAPSSQLPTLSSQFPASCCPLPGTAGGPLLHAQPTHTQPSAVPSFVLAFVLGSAIRAGIPRRRPQPPNR